MYPNTTPSLANTTFLPPPTTAAFTSLILRRTTPDLTLFSWLADILAQTCRTKKCSREGKRSTIVGPKDSPSQTTLTMPQFKMPSMVLSNSPSIIRRVLSSRRKCSHLLSIFLVCLSSPSFPVHVIHFAPSPFLYRVVNSAVPQAVTQWGTGHLDAYFNTCIAFFTNSRPVTLEQLANMKSSPCMIVHGQDDIAYPAELAHRNAELLTEAGVPIGSVVEIPQATHYASVTGGKRWVLSSLVFHSLTFALYAFVTDELATVGCVIGSTICYTNGF